MVGASVSGSLPYLGCGQDWQTCKAGIRSHSWSWKAQPPPLQNGGSCGALQWKSLSKSVQRPYGWQHLKAVSSREYFLPLDREQQPHWYQCCNLSGAQRFPGGPWSPRRCLGNVGWHPSTPGDPAGDCPQLPVNLRSRREVLHLPTSLHFLFPKYRDFQQVGVKLPSGEQKEAFPFIMTWMPGRGNK